MEGLFSIHNLIALLSLTVLEIVLGIDNIVVIALIVQRLKQADRARARFLGLLLAMFFRIILLLFLNVIMHLDNVLFTVADQDFSGKSLLLLFGGLFLIAKATIELHKVSENEHATGVSKVQGLISAILQILLIDIIFSLDSVITAIGMAQEISIMISAIVIAMFVMWIFTSLISDFIERYPTLKTLALSFVLLIGVILSADGLGHHISRVYIYFAMGFSMFVEFFNIRMRSNSPR